MFALTVLSLRLTMAQLEPIQAHQTIVTCRAGATVAIDTTELPEDSPLRHIVCGRGALVGASELDVDAAVLRLVLSWLSPACEEAERLEAARNLDERRLGEAIEWSDYLCVPSLRQQLQRRALKGRIRQAEEERHSGERGGGFDAVATLTAFERSDRQVTVLKGLSPAEIGAVCDSARLLQLRTLRLGSEFPRAIVVARQGAHIDLTALGLEHAPRGARRGKHGRGGSRRRSGSGSGGRGGGGSP